MNDAALMTAPAGSAGGPGMQKSCVLACLTDLINAHGEEISQWLSEAYARHEIPFYSSVDLRHSGCKLAPVDTNLFPAGFNNLSQAGRLRARVAFQRMLSRRWPQARRLLILPENHTRNLGYLENLRVLSELLEASGLEVRIGRLESEGDQPLELETLTGNRIIQFAVKRSGTRLQTVDGYDPDLLISNNDFTSGVPDLLRGLEQPLTPSPEHGWFRRRKSQHFAAYAQVAESFGKAFDFDSWRIAPLSVPVNGLDFKAQRGLDALAEAVDEVIVRTQAKYDEYGVEEKPYVFIKADSGTYGMGIMTAASGEEVRSLNKKTRNKMNVVKEGAEVHEVLVQEGILTADRVGGSPAEPMIYLVDGRAVGGAYRVNASRDDHANLNAAGMLFTGMCGEAEQDGSRIQVRDCNFGVFGLVAQLATLAAARE